MAVGPGDSSHDPFRATVVRQRPNPGETGDGRSIQLEHLSDSRTRTRLRTPFDPPATPDPVRPPCESGSHLDPCASGPGLSRLGPVSGAVRVPRESPNRGRVALSPCRSSDCGFGRQREHPASCGWVALVARSPPALDDSEIGPGSSHRTTGVASPTTVGADLRTPSPRVRGRTWPSQRRPRARSR